MDTNISACASFPIFTLFFMSETFFSLNVLLSRSYIPFSSERVNITVLPACSNSFCTFNVIFKFILASEVPSTVAPPIFSAHVQHLKLLLFYLLEVLQFLEFLFYLMVLIEILLLILLNILILN